MPARKNRPDKYGGPVHRTMKEFVWRDENGLTPEERLLRSIFGDPQEERNDASDRRP